jgi:predicted permease
VWRCPVPFGTSGQLSRAAVEQQGEVVAVLGITYVAVFLVVYFWAARWERFSPAQSAVLALMLSHPNVAAVGYPLLHGPASGVAVAARLTIGSITVVPVTLAVLENNTGNRNPNLRAGGRSIVHSIVNALKTRWYGRRFSESSSPYSVSIWLSAWSLVRPRWAALLDPDSDRSMAEYEECRLERT